MSLSIKASLPSKCPLCSAEALTTEQETHTDGATEYTLHTCRTCMAQFWWPLKNPGSSWYEHDERYSDRNRDPILAPNNKHKGVLEFLKGKEGSVLDVGCGVGNFLAYAVSLGWKGWGIDFDRDAIEAGKRAFKLENLSVADLETFLASHQQQRFDLVTFFDVFEHLDDHTVFLDKVKGALTSNGHIALSVPYRHAWRWLIPHDLPPRHLTRWDEKSLAAILGRHGFTIRLLRRFPATLYYLTMKMRFRYGRWSSVGLVQKAQKQSGAGTSSRNLELIRLLAKVKDILLFGLPALILWLILLPQRGRYTDIWLVAERTH